MDISRKDIDQNNAVITIRVIKPDYAEKIEKQLKSYRKKANIPGFRPGNVPIGLIKKMYGKAMLAEEVQNLMAETLINYIRENNIKTLGEPLPSETEQKEIDFEHLENFEFVFDLGIAPEVDVELSGKDKVDYYNIAVSNEMIDNQIKSYTGRFGKYEQADTVQERDMVKGELLEMADGKVNEEGIKVQEAVLTPDYMKDADQKALFVGAKKGDKVVFNPQKAYESEVEISSLLKISKDQAKTIHSDFEMAIQSITRYTEGEINQELFDKVYGEGVVNSEEEFRNKISDSIKETLKTDSEYKFGIDAREMVVAKCKDVTFPDAFLKRWLKVSESKMTDEQIAKDYPKMREDLIWYLAKEKIGSSNNLKIELADVEEYAKNVARAQFAQYGMVGMEDAILENYAKDMMKKEETAHNFAEKAMENKVLEIIKEKVKLNTIDISMDDFNKMFEVKQ